MVKNLSCVSYGSLKRFPHIYIHYPLGAICNSNKFHYADHHDHTFSLVSHYIQASAYIHIVHTYMDNSFHNRQYVLNSEYTFSN